MLSHSSGQSGSMKKVLQNISDQNKRAALRNTSLIASWHFNMAIIPNLTRSLTQIHRIHRSMRMNVLVSQPSSLFNFSNLKIPHH
jgi:hypothetical protein